MRILHLVHNFPPEYRGGTESYVLHLARRQCRTGAAVLVVSGSAEERPAGGIRRELVEGVRVVRLFRKEGVERYRVKPHHPRLSRACRDLLRGFDPHVVHVHHWHHLTDDLVRTASGEGFPVVLTLHDFFAACARFFRVKPGARGLCPPGQSPGECYSCIRKEHALWPAELVCELYARRRAFAAEVARADGVYTFSRTVAEFFQAIPWFPARAVEARPIGALRTLGRGVPRPDRRPLQVVNWGGQTVVKGAHLLLEAAARPELSGKVEVHLLGRVMDPAYGRRLETLARRCGAKIHGPFPEREKDTFGRRFDVAVFPTMAFETYSIVVDEALAMGLPVITTEPGAQCERVGAAGRIVPAGDVDALAGALRAMLDPAVRLEAARAAQAVEVGTLDRHWLSLRELYRRLAAHSRRHGGRRGRGGRTRIPPASPGRARRSVRRRRWGNPRRTVRGSATLS